MRPTIGWVLLACLFCAPTLADDPLKKPCETEPHHQLDFWVGVWDVYNADGKHVGENTITAHQCMLYENWKGDTGSRGMSLNFIDPATGLWTQEWADNSGGRITLRGRFQDGAMRMTGVHVMPYGGKRPFKGTWMLLEDGRVHQTFEEVAKKGEPYTIWFDGYYKKRDE